MHTVNPVGVSPYTLPEYHLWLQQPAKKRHQDIEQWVSMFERLESVVRYILELVRQCGMTKQVTADNGFYQDRLETGVPNQLVSAKLDSSLNLFPEISVGRQRISIHFMQLSCQYFQKTTDAIDFALTFYRLG
jgi:cell division protein ZapD